MFESKAEIENIEIEALRHQVIDLQTQTDEKVSFFQKYWLSCQYFQPTKNLYSNYSRPCDSFQALIGRLHRQIVGLQTKESQTVGKIHGMNGKIGRLEAQLFRLTRKADEKEDLVIQARSQAYIKCRYTQFRNTLR